MSVRPFTGGSAVCGLSIARSRGPPAVLVGLRRPTSNVTRRRTYTTPPSQNASHATQSLSAPPTSSTSSVSASTSSAALNSARLNRYLPRLRELSTRTGVPVPSLIISFMILHELTAIVPVFLFFLAFQALGAGASIVSWISSLNNQEGRDNAGDQAEVHDESIWNWRARVGRWYAEGEKRVERVGKRYGILGYEKADKIDDGGEATSTVTRSTSGGAAEKVASAISAYVVVKALLPLRIAVSLGGAPGFARFALNPIQRLVGRTRSAKKVT